MVNAGPARSALATEQLHAPHLIDPEVAAGVMSADDGWIALDTWRRLGLTRYPVLALLDRVWELRDSVSAYAASYVALAEHLGCALMSADGRLGRASGIRCPVTVVPR